MLILFQMRSLVHQEFLVNIFSVNIRLLRLFRKSMFCIFFGSTKNSNGLNRLKSIIETGRIHCDLPLYCPYKHFHQYRIDIYFCDNAKKHHAAKKYRLTIIPFRHRICVKIPNSNCISQYVKKKLWHNSYNKQ